MKKSLPQLFSKLTEHAAADRIRLHVPGHGGGLGLPRRLLLSFADVARFDLTELPGLDDLHNPTGIIAAAQELAAEFWRARRTFFLVNGSTAGVLAMLLAACNPGESVLVARNAHGSVYSGLILGGLLPSYLPVAMSPGGFPLNVSPKDVEDGFRRCPSARAVLITSPSYHGVCADIPAIAAIARKHGALLLLDEAHGAHLGLHPKLPAASGHEADLRVQSWHKTLGAMTPGAVLHLHSERVDIERLQNALAWVQTSSPPYPLLLSLEAAWEQAAAHGRDIYEEACSCSLILRSLIRPTLPLLERRIVNRAGFDLDITRLTILTGAAGISGLTAASFLARAGIDIEMASPDHLLALFGPSFKKRQLSRVLGPFSRLQEIPAGYKLNLPPMPAPQTAVSPRSAAFGKVCPVDLRVAVGKVAAAAVVTYPPGIPVLAPGELVTEEIVDYLLLAKEAGITWRGLDPQSRLRVMTGEGKAYE